MSNQKRIGVIGSGYVGLVTGACLAKVGHQVMIADVDNSKIQKLNSSECPIYEPGLEEILWKHAWKGNLKFTSDMEALVTLNDILFICVGTPSGEDGSTDLSYVISVAETIGKYMNVDKIVIDKSTVPVGTGDLVGKTINSKLLERGVEHSFHVVSNPEFLKEGTAVKDLMEGERIVIGLNKDRVDSDDVLKNILEMYEPFPGKKIVMGLREAEITKYAANAFLMVKLTFMNEIARLCDATQANVMEVIEGIGSDSRIGEKFLLPGPGSLSGSCFPGYYKAILPDSTKITLEELYLRVSNGEKINIKSTDHLITKDEEKEILEVSKRTVEELIEFTLSDGRIIRCTEDHLFPIIRNNSMILKKAKDIKGDDLFVSSL